MKVKIKTRGEARPSEEQPPHVEEDLYPQAVLAKQLDDLFIGKNRLTIPELIEIANEKYGIKMSLKKNTGRHPTKIEFEDGGSVPVPHLSGKLNFEELRPGTAEAIKRQILDRMQDICISRSNGL